MTEKEIVKLREILGRIIRCSKHNPDLELIKSLALEADNLVKESDFLQCFSGSLQSVRIMKPKYLVRPDDFGIFDLDESNGCYRSWSKKPITYSDGTRPNAMEHFTLENLTKNYGFFEIDESEIEIYEQKCDEHYKFLSWQSRSDGHGGSKGGTYGEYLEARKKYI